ncbi:cytochrome c biogenesis protein CcdA [Desulfobacula sp.]|uniref:cytochrome c biogenesis protein CcdA n=1 Tax=Desulfobacula sp. TaxID=2593537 RepID=UPI0039B8D8F6
MLSFFSPCILPLIPAYFSFITGYSADWPNFMLLTIHILGYTFSIKVFAVLKGRRIDFSNIYGIERKWIVYMKGSCHNSYPDRKE